MIWGTIKESPILAFNELGEGDLLALNFADLFGWASISISTSGRGTNLGRLEKRGTSRAASSAMRVLAAEFTNQGRVLQGYAYVSRAAKKLGYLRRGGKSLEKEFRGLPSSGRRVTSRFSSSRSIRSIKSTGRTTGWITPPT